MAAAPFSGIGILFNNGEQKMKRVTKVFDMVTTVFIRISSVILIALVVLMIVNVIGRKLFNSPISGTIELVQYGILICIGLAISRTGFEDRQLSVTMIQELLPAKGRAVLKCFCSCVAGLLFGSLIINYIRVIPKALQSGRVSDVMHIPYYLIYYLLIVAMFLVAVTFFYQAVLVVYKAFSGTEEVKTKEEGGKA